MENTDQLAQKPKRPRISTQHTVVSTTSVLNKDFVIKEDILKEIGQIADNSNTEVYVVGGYVRDYFLGREQTDLDFTVVGDSINFAKEVARHYKTKPIIYEKFRTALVQTGQYKCEFVGTRKEKYYHDSRNPVVTEGSLDDDIRRRDFTINTIAVSLNQDKFGTIVDIFSGKKDIDRRIIRTPLEPTITYNDDPLRMVRAARFAAQLGFEVEEGSFRAIKKIADRINIVAQERITEEFLKILAAKKPSKGLRLLYESDLFLHIFPELHKLAGVESKFDGKQSFAHKDILRHTFKVLDNVAERSTNLWLRFAALVHDIAKPAVKRFTPGMGWSFHGHEDVGARWIEDIFRRLRLPLDKVDYVERLVRLHQRPMQLVDEGVTDSAVRRLAFHAGDALEDLFLLCRADITTNNPHLSEQYLNNYEIVFQKVVEVQEKDKLREFQSPVRGEEIMELCDLQPSKPVGMVKSRIEEAILDGIIPNEHDAARSYLLENKDAWLEEINNVLNG
ncbi:MAG: cca [Ignavibacteria bacterium]|nr:cca [Ignavibacteria bacterium]